MERVIFKALCALTIAGLSACGGGGGKSGDVALTPSGAAVEVAENYFPMSVGNRWVYRSWDDDSRESSYPTFVQVSGTVTTEGRSAKVLRHFFAPNGNEYQTQYLALTDRALVALKDPTLPADQLQFPSMDMVRFGAGARASFQATDQTVDARVDGDGDGINERWQLKEQVETIGLESVSLSVGPFEKCLHVKTVIEQTFIYSTGGAPYVVTTTVHSWFAQGIGLVKEDVSTEYPNRTPRSFHRELYDYSVEGVKTDTQGPTPRLLQPTGTDPFSSVEIEFDEWVDMNTVHAESVELRDAQGHLISLSMSVGSSSFRFYPAQGALSGGAYTATLLGTVTDLVGNKVAKTAWTFNVDNTAPVLVSATPSDGAKYVSLSPTITLTFSEELDPASVTNNVSVLQDLTPTPANIAVDGKVVRVTPLGKLKPHSNYSVSIGAGVTDRAHNQMGQGLDVRFQTDPGLFDYPTIPVGSSSGESPGQVAVADVNGDGLTDVVTTVTSWVDGNPQYKLQVRLQLPDGSLGLATSYVLSQPANCQPSALAVGDFNGDGKKDVVVAQLECGLQLLFQKADGMFEQVGFLSSPDVRNVRSADMDKDGVDEIVSLHLTGNQIAVWKHQGGGAFARVQSANTGLDRISELELADMNGDGRLDAVVAVQFGGVTNAIAIAYQQQDGSLGNLRFVPAISLTSFGVGDVNGDGRPDIVIGSDDTRIAVMIQDATGHMSLSAYYPVRYPTSSVKIADVNGDGRSDVVVVNDPTQPVVYLQSSNGLLADAEIDRTNPMTYLRNSSVIALADINGDRWPDLVLAGGATMINRSGQLMSLGATRAQASSLKRAGLPTGNQMLTGTMNWMRPVILPGKPKSLMY